MIKLKMYAVIILLKEWFFLKKNLKIIVFRYISIVFSIISEIILRKHKRSIPEFYLLTYGSSKKSTSYISL